MSDVSITALVAKAREAVARSRWFDTGEEPLIAALADALEAVTVPSEETSDGYHTFRELYEYRMLYNAHAARGWLAAGVPVVKSWHHSDGEKCFGGGWFVVSAELPAGQVTNHYSADHWGIFHVPEVALPPEYDGHTPSDVADRLRLPVPVETTPDERDTEVNRITQSNTVAGIVIAEAKTALPGFFVTLDFRYGVADALWVAGFRLPSPVKGECPECHGVGYIGYATCVRCVHAPATAVPVEPETPERFPELPHVEAKYWAELVRARRRIAELEAVEPEWGTEIRDEEGNLCDRDVHPDEETARSCALDYGDMLIRREVTPWLPVDPQPQETEEEEN